MRGTLKVLLGLALLLALGMATLPWWLGIALRPLARARGATFENYETVGYARLRLENVEVIRPGIVFSAREITLDTPVAWLLRRSQARAQISRWELRLTPRDTAGTGGPSSNTSPARVQAQVRQTLQVLRRWLPRLTAENGTIARGGQ
jgi:hypothetical protein